MKGKSVEKSGRGIIKKNKERTGRASNNETDNSNHSTTKRKVENSRKGHYYKRNRKEREQGYEGVESQERTKEEPYHRVVGQNEATR